MESSNGLDGWYYLYVESEKYPPVIYKFTRVTDTIYLGEAMIPKGLEDMYDVYYNRKKFFEVTNEHFREKFEMVNHIIPSSLFRDYDSAVREFLTCYFEDKEEKTRWADLLESARL